MDASDELLRRAGPAALLTLDGVINGLNAAMATALGRPAEKCLGRDLGDLWPARQRMSAGSLVATAARSKTVAMRVLEFPGQGGASVACLIEALSLWHGCGTAGITAKGQFQRIKPLNWPLASIHRPMPVDDAWENEEVPCDLR